ncbi:thymidine kinase [Criibacterium bergeronii]|uniref:Thymidine kinase n=1 Tax=Criibacterium bergeronii TaxID=1871336 RepID=A0A552VB82_9FIRM|nr:thymidine kinase [Criibacterium bergeronii]TRW27745.1 thymidine kinase [Criibacterium bergeronii]
MAKLYFRYATMNGGKTLDLIRSAYNYQEMGMDVIVLKPEIGTRTEEINELFSRAGVRFSCTPFSKEADLNQIILNGKNYRAVFVDEAQFLTKEQVDQLSRIAELNDIPVLCYGLRNNFKTELFEGSKRLMELADTIGEIKSICKCGRKATQNARLIDGKMATDGAEILIGDKDIYEPVCAKCYYEMLDNQN